jgi:mitochondrial fission protein ELM1
MRLFTCGQRGWAGSGAIVAKILSCRRSLQCGDKFCKLSVFAQTFRRPVDQPGFDSQHPPSVWVLTGHKAGDNAQVSALAEALGWPYTVKRFYYQPYELLTNRLLGATLVGIDRGRSSDLAPPWPDLVITAGRRNEPIARWIRRRGNTRLVHVGRPWAPLDSFDLIVTTPQYFLPERANVLHNHLPLHGVNRDRLAQAADAWRARLQHLPRPWTALLVGGDSGPFVFTRAKGRRLGRLAKQLAQDCGGTLLVTSSARTPVAAFAELQAQITVPADIHAWCAGGVDNPYLAYLALADQFVVTGESMSMLTEAAYTGKPLYIFDPGDAGPWWRYLHNYRFKPLSHHFAMRFAPRRMHRDVGNIQRQLVGDGRAVWLGETFTGSPDSLLPDDVDRAVARVRALFAPD